MAGFVQYKNQMEKRSAFVTAGAAAGVFVSGGFARAASADADAGIGAHQLLGARYDTMLSLARCLDATAQRARQAAENVERAGSLVPARLLSDVRSFARAATELFGTMGERQVTGIDLPARLAALAHRVRLLNARIGSTDALAATCGEWVGVADVIERMRRLVAGNDVVVPSAYVQGALRGGTVRALRQLASDVEASSARAHGKATRAAGGYRKDGEQFLGELRHFAGQSRDLRLQAAGTVPAQVLGSVVDHLLGEARQVHRRMQQARVFTEVREDSARTITDLERMASLVRTDAPDRQPDPGGPTARA